MDHQTSTPECYAIVPFSYASPFADPLKQENRLIRIGDKEYNITQHWKDDKKGGTVLGFGAAVYGCAVVLADYITRCPWALYPPMPSHETAPLTAGIATISHDHPQESTESTAVFSKLPIGNVVGELGRVHMMRGTPTVVIELGAGCGLTSLAAEFIHVNSDASVEYGTSNDDAIYPVHAVFSTDGDELVCEYLQENLTANGSKNCKVQKLFWGNSADITALQTTINATIASLSVDRVNVCVVAADVVALPYAEALTALVDTVAAFFQPDFFCKGVCTRFLMAYQPRHHLEAAFFEGMATIADVEVVPNAEIHPDYQARYPPISVMIFTSRRH